MIWIIDQIWDNKLDLVWITDMITNKITDRITDKIIDKITDMTSKLQMLTIYHNFCYGCPFEAHYISKCSEFRRESR